MNKFTSYKAVQFANDTEFADWVTNPTKEKDELWQNFQKQYPHLKEEISLARNIIENFLPVEDQISSEAIHSVWKRVSKKKRHGLKTYLNAAAAIIFILILIGGGIIYNEKSQEDNFLAFEENTDSYSQLFSNNENPILFDQDQVDLDFSKDSGILMNNDSTLHIIQSEKGNKSIMEKIVVPYGKRIFLTLNDKSRVCINSGSQLVFPRKFDSSKREVFLVGEALFKVTHNEEMPFIVHTKNSSVKVLGTSFNVKAYADENYEETVLVSGKVSLSKKNIWDKPTILKPGQMGKYFSNEDFFKVKEVDVAAYTSWAEGYLIFKNKIAREVLLQVSRYYNKEIEVQANANFVTFTGKLDLTEDFDVILKRITKTSSLRYFYENDKIIIKQ